MKKIFTVVLFLMLGGAVFLNCSFSGTAMDHQDKKLLLLVNIGEPELGRWLNEHLEDGDSVGVWFGKFRNFTFVSNRKLIRSMTGGNYQKIMNSLEDLKKNGIKLIIYDIEPGGRSITEDEINDPVKYTRLLKEFCKQNNFQLALAPSKEMIKKLGVELARYADQFLFMTGAGQEKSPEIFRKEMVKRITPIKSSNPNIQTFVQLRTFHQKRGERRGAFSTTQLMNYAEAIKDYVDGIAVIYSKDTVDVMKEFVLRFKSKY